MQQVSMQAWLAGAVIYSSVSAGTALADYVTSDVLSSTICAPEGELDPLFTHEVSPQGCRA